MKIRRIWLLIKNEVLHGPKDTILVMAIVMPILLALFVNLAFGNIFTERAKLGIYDEGNSALVPKLESDSTIILKVYNNESQLKAAAASGAVDMGFVLPADFDRNVENKIVKLKAYVWGESQAKNRALVPMLLASSIRELSGSDLPVKIETIPMGEENSQPWSDRLLPITVLMAVFFGGMMLPAASLINEKNRRTLEALYVTPVTIGEIFIAKGVIGVVLATFMGVLTLLISSGLNGVFPSLVLVLIMGAAMAAGIGLLAGALIKDLNTLYAFWKIGALLLFGPAIVYMFPQIPQWIGYFFPTFYVIRPVVDLSVNGAGFGDIALYLTILAVLIVVLFLIVNRVVRRLSTRALSVN